MSSTAAHIDYKALFEQQQSAYQLLLKNFEAQQQANLQLQYQLHQLTKMLQGFRTERFVPAVAKEQINLGLVFEEAAAATDLTKAKKITYVVPQQPAKQQPVKEDAWQGLRREEIILEPAEDISGCERNGEEVHEQLSWKPGEIFVKRMVLPRYSCPVAGKTDKQHIVIASLPVQALPKSSADASLLAQVVIDKFIDHKPLHRQLAYFKRHHVEIASSTISDWVRQVAGALSVIGDAHLRQMLRAAYWKADETTIQVLDPAKKQSSHKGYYWTYMTGDGRMIYYDYHPGRDRARPQGLLKNFTGYLQCDGYEVYDNLGIEGITVFFCMAHARRKFYDSLGNDRARAEHALTEIGKLYKIEEQCRSQQLSEEQVKAMRIQQATPILTALGAWMKAEYVKLKPQSPIARAMAYSIKRWDKLSLYATTGHLDIDNNSIERCMKNLAVGRKNYLFCGSHDAAKRAGILYSLLVTCKLNDVNPYEWLKDILSRDINSMHINRVKELLPYNWKPQQAKTLG